MKISRFTTTAAVLAIATSGLALAGAGVVHWGYRGHEGPGHWAELSRDNAACGLGKEQSPINISGAQPADLPAIAFDYKPSALKIVNNGHTVQVNYDAGSHIAVGNERFQLVQFHFHTPSEEQVNGKSYDMVWHLVHRNDAGKLAVVAVLVRGGKPQSVIDTVAANLPKQQGKEQIVAGKTINVADLLPTDRGYYHFMGSLTTPPCSEGVKWFVLKQPVEASSQQVATFSKLFGSNARPVQPLHARVVKQTR